MTDHAVRHVSSGLIGLLLLLGGCAGDGTSDTLARSDLAVGRSTADEEHQGLEEFCESYLAADALVGPALSIGGDALSDLRSAYAGVNGVPPELEEPMRVMRDEVAYFAGESAVEPSTDEFDAASVQITEWVIERCELIAWEITADDYQFETLETLRPGSYEIRFSNLGEEYHEAQVIQINASVDMALAELLELDEPELLDRVTPLTGAFAAPDETSRQILTLTEEGRYGIVCLIPVGSTPGAIESGLEPSGPPHFSKGMFVEFVVTN